MRPVAQPVDICNATFAIHNFVTGCRYALERKQNSGK
jgi:hypothetical protein